MGDKRYIVRKYENEKGETGKIKSVGIMVDGNTKIIELNPKDDYVEQLRSIDDGKFYNSLLGDDIIWMNDADKKREIENVERMLERYRQIDTTPTKQMVKRYEKKLDKILRKYNMNKNDEVQEETKEKGKNNMEEERYIVSIANYNGKDKINWVGIRTDEGLEIVHLTNQDATDIEGREAYYQQLHSIDDGKFFPDFVMKRNCEVTEGKAINSSTDANSNHRESKYVDDSIKNYRNKVSNWLASNSPLSADNALIADAATIYQECFENENMSDYLMGHNWTFEHFAGDVEFEGFIEKVQPNSQTYTGPSVEDAVYVKFITTIPEWPLHNRRSTAIDTWMPNLENDMKFAREGIVRFELFIEKMRDRGYYLGKSDPSDPMHEKDDFPIDFYKNYDNVTLDQIKSDDSTQCYRFTRHPKVNGVLIDPAELGKSR